MFLWGMVIAAAGVGLLAMAVLCVAAPGRARRFLGGFASSARAHYLELGLRLVAGAALVLFSPSMHLAEIFRLFGWVIIATSVALLCIPWRWHQRFAGRVVPIVNQYLGVYAVGNLALGVLLLYGIARPFT